jgi:hypothetical protein
MTGDPGRISLGPNPVPPVEGNPAPPRFWAINGEGTAIKNTISQMQIFARCGKRDNLFMVVPLSSRPDVATAQHAQRDEP